MALKSTRWIGHQLKSRIKYDRALLLSAPPERIPRPIWNMIVDYTCEDPRIVDAILNSGYLVQGNNDFEGYVEISHNLTSYDDEPDLTGYQGWIPDGRTPSGFNIDWVIMCDEMFELLLMLPVLSSDGSESECLPLRIHDLRMREMLYATLLK